MPNDRISKASEGRYFPMPVEEFISHVAAMSFSFHDYYRRLPIIMQNCTVECPLGHQLCSFFRKGYIAQFSLPSAVSPQLAEKAISAAIEKMKVIDEMPSLAIRNQQFVIYRAYLGALGHLSITQHVNNGQHRSYLRFQAASQLSKAHRDPKGQRVLFNVSLA